MKLPSFSRLFVLGTLTLVTLVIVGERVTSFWLERKLKHISEGKRFDYESASINLYQRALRLYNFDLKGTDSTSQPLHVEKITAKGIGIIDLIRNHSVSIKRLVLENGTIRITGHIRNAADSTGPAVSLRGLDIESIQLTNTSVSYSDSATTWSGLVDLNLHHTSLKDPTRPLSLASYESGVRSISIRHAKMEQHHGFFSATMARIDFDHEKDMLTCDSIHIIPSYPKLQFARARGTQSTWADVTLPHIEARGFDFNYHKDTTLAASHIIISDAHIEAFRDRRVPLNRRAEVPLPMKWLREWDLAIEVDSITVSGMNILYEHFSEDGFKPGRLQFKNLNAVFRNVFNRSYNNTKPITTLTAVSDIMGGRIKANFTFPLEAGVKYEAQGTVSNLSLPSLNPMLENAAFVSVESGLLRELDFRFRYDNNMSVGEVTVDYEDLKIKGLKKDRAGNENQVKSAVANTALKNNNRKTGPIDNERDKRRFIFHYWATSIMDGMRNAIVPVAAESKKKKK